MADDWQAGDLALCIKVGPWKRFYANGTSVEGFGPRAGMKLYVRSVDVSVLGGAALKFSDWPDVPEAEWTGYTASRFRKIRPHTPDAEDAETIRLLTGAPVREPAA